MILKFGLLPTRSSANAAQSTGLPLDGQAVLDALDARRADLRFLLGLKHQHLAACTLASRPSRV